MPSHVAWKRHRSPQRHASEGIRHVSSLSLHGYFGRQKRVGEEKSITGAFLQKPAKLPADDAGNIFRRHRSAKRKTAEKVSAEEKLTWQSI